MKQDKNKMIDCEFFQDYQRVEYCLKCSKYKNCPHMVKGDSK